MAKPSVLFGNINWKSPSARPVLSNANNIIITVKNTAGTDAKITINKYASVSELQSKIYDLPNSFVERVSRTNGSELYMVLFKQPDIANEKTRVILDDAFKTLDDYSIENGDIIYVVMNEHSFTLTAPPAPELAILKRGGKRSRRKSHRRRKSRGKKSRKH